jgi:glycogen debranching enzyme
VGDGLIILDGCTFFSTGETGDADAGDAEGLFYQDVRHVSHWRLSVDGRAVEPLSSRRVDYFSARVVGVPGEDGDDPALSVRRDRFVSEGMHEDVVVENLTPEPRSVRVELAYGSDFADVMEAQEGGTNGAGRSGAELTARTATLWNEREGYRRETVITFSRHGRVSKDQAVFDVELGPRESWSLCVDVTPVVDGERRPPLLRCDSFGDHAPKMPMSLDAWIRAAPDLETGDDGLRRTYRQSVLDLAALRVRPDDTIRWAMPGGGLPWFMTVFGRDSLITAFECLPFHPELAHATLVALASMQATEWDNWRDAEPGKILHELRRGTLAALGKIPHTPYYGTHDATLLFLIVLDEYERWSGDRELVRSLEPNARAALAWLEGPADLDGDGFVEYRRRSTSDRALDNQCWKDSESSILFADGTRAEPPIAVCEHQGYAYDARLRTARLCRELWDDDETAARLEADAATLRERFEDAFWIPSRGHYALALDGDKRPVDSMTSNPGHLLWSGIADERRARQTVRRLLAEDMSSGWGIRSMSSLEAGYNPLEYHNGTVWPHDTALAAWGMRRYGFAEEAARVCEALLDAAEAFGHQLPEVFAGFRRDDARVPVEYPGALKPQSWAAAAPLLALRTLLGLDVVDGELRVDPVEAPGIGPVRLRGLQFRGGRVNVP